MKNNRILKALEKYKSPFKEPNYTGACMIGKHMLNIQPRMCIGKQSLSKNKVKS